MNKFKIVNTIVALLLVATIIALPFSLMKKSTMEPITDFIDVPLEKGEKLRLEKLSPIGKTLKDNGTIFVDESGEMWILDNFYAEKNEKFVALLSDKATKDKTDDVIMEIWLVLE